MQNKDSFIKPLRLYLNVNLEATYYQTFRAYPNEEQVASFNKIHTQYIQNLNYLLVFLKDYYLRNSKLPDVPTFNGIMMKNIRTNKTTLYAKYQAMNELRNFVSNNQNNPNPDFDIRPVSYFTATESGFNTLSKHVYLFGLGKVKVKYHQKLYSKPKFLKLYKDAMGHWYACFVVEKTVAKPRVRPSAKDYKPIGIKLEVQDKVATVSENITNLRDTEMKLKNEGYRALKRNTHQYDYSFGKNVQKTENRIKNLRSKLSTATTGKSKLVKKIQKLEVKLNNQKKAYLHEYSREINNRYNHLVVEYVQFNESDRDRTQANFRRYLQYKAQENHNKFEFKTISNPVCSTCKQPLTVLFRKGYSLCTNCGFSVNPSVIYAQNLLSHTRYRRVGYTRNARKGISTVENASISVKPSSDEPSSKPLSAVQLFLKEREEMRLVEAKKQQESERLLKLVDESMRRVHKVTITPFEPKEIRKEELTATSSLEEMLISSDGVIGVHIPKPQRTVEVWGINDIPGQKVEEEEAPPRLGEYKYYQLSGGEVYNETDYQKWLVEKRAKGIDPEEYVQEKYNSIARANRQWAWEQSHPKQSNPTEQAITEINKAEETLKEAAKNLGSEALIDGGVVETPINPEPITRFKPRPRGRPKKGQEYTFGPGLEWLDGKFKIEKDKKKVKHKNE